MLLEKCKEAREKDILMSRRHCHAKNVSSIVVDNYDGRLTRAFLAWPGHELHTNRLGQDMAVGIHDHRYDIQLLLIYGTVRNTIYRWCIENSLSDIKKSYDLFEWEYGSKGLGHRPSLEWSGTRSLVVDREDYLAGDSILHLNYDETHGIDCEGQAAWWVIEGEVKQEITLLYTANPFPINIDGLYEPFESKDEVIEHVEKFLEFSKETD